MLWTFAFAKPLFDVLADSPEFFVARGNTRADIVLFALAMVLLPPTVLVALEAALTRWPAARRALHLLFIAGLSAAFALQVLDDLIDSSSEVLVLVAAVLGAIAALAYARTRPVPAMLTVLSPAPVVFLVLFLLVSPVSRLVLPQEQAHAADADIRSDSPVVFVVFDELDGSMLMDADERIDASRYPNFAALADDATWYRNATTVNSATTLAIPALLSGRRPLPKWLPITADYPNNLFTLLEDSHEVHARELATELCPASVCGDRERPPLARRLRLLAKDLGIVSAHLVAPPGLESRLPAVDQTFGDFGDGGRDDTATADAPGGQPDVPAAALTDRPAVFGSLVDGIDAGAASLHFLHSGLPHIPTQYLPTGEQYLNSGPEQPGLLVDRWSDAPFPAVLGLQRHLLQVGYVDRLLGRLLQRLRRTGIYEDSLIVVTADHGVSYRPGESRRGPSEGNASDIASVPLLIKFPGEGRGRIDDTFVRTIDVMPTIAQALGTELPWEADGRPVRNGGAGSGTVTVGIGATGRRFTMSFAEFVRRRRAGLDRRLFLFGANDGGKRLYASGPDFDLLGRRVERLTTAPGRRARVELDGDELLEDYRPGQKVAPSFVSGRLVGDLEAGTRLAVAVNGVVRGVTTAFLDGEEHRMAAIVPAAAFRAGGNAVEVFAIEGRRDARTFARVVTERPREYRMVERDGTTTIVGAGREARVRNDALEGYAESFEEDDQGVVVYGWSVDPERGRPAEVVLLVDDGRVIAQSRPRALRKDIQSKYRDPGVARSGFQLRARSAGIDVDDLRVFAVSGDSAAELPRYKE